MSIVRKKPIKLGFTIIEVMLFLAVTGFLIMGIMAGTGVSVSRQRYNDSVQTFTQFLREQYSSVTNIRIVERNNDSICYGVSPESAIEDGSLSSEEIFGSATSSGDSGRGRTNCLVYGIMVTFGLDNGNKVQISPLIGRDIYSLSNADSLIESNSDLDLLRLANVSNLTITASSEDLNTGLCYVRTTGGTTSSYLQWDAETQTTAAGGETLRAVMLIFRSPKDGTIKTYVSNPTDPDEAMIASDQLPNSMFSDYSGIDSANGGLGYILGSDSGGCNSSLSASDGYSVIRDIGINQYLTSQYFAERTLDICIGSGDVFAYAGQRRMIRVSAKGRNASAIELLSMDSGDNLCL